MVPSAAISTLASLCILQSLTTTFLSAKKRNIYIKHCIIILKLYLRLLITGITPVEISHTWILWLGVTVVITSFSYICSLWESSKSASNGFTPEYNGCKNLGRNNPLADTLNLCRFHDLGLNVEFASEIGTSFTWTVGIFQGLNCEEDEDDELDPSLFSRFMLLLL